jgi:hypothetical protein
MMDPDADFVGGNDYPGTGRLHSDIRSNCPTRPGIRFSGEPEVLIEFMVVDGPEGERLHQLQAEAVRHVLTHLADKRRRETAEGEAES